MLTKSRAVLPNENTITQTMLYHIAKLCILHFINNKHHLHVLATLCGQCCQCPSCAGLGSLRRTRPCVEDTRVGLSPQPSGRSSSWSETKQTVL